MNGQMVVSSSIVSCRDVESAQLLVGAKLPDACHQVKLTLVIAAISYCYDRNNPQATSLFRCAGRSQPLRPRSSGVRDFAAGLVDADQGTRRGSRRRAYRERRTTSPAYEVRRRGRPEGARRPALG